MFSSVGCNTFLFVCQKEMRIGIWLIMPAIRVSGMGERGTQSVIVDCSSKVTSHKATVIKLGKTQEKKHEF